MTNRFPFQSWLGRVPGKAYSMQLGTLLLLGAASACAQNAPNAPTPTNPFPEPIATTGGVTVNYREFATIPNLNGNVARMMALTDEPGTGRLFVTDMNGVIYRVSYDGASVTNYLDLPASGIAMQTQNAERGLQSIAFHPQFGQQGAPGYGKFYTLLDTSDMEPAPDFRPLGGGNTHDSVLIEWTVRNANATAYDGAAPREMMRWEQPYPNHNLGHMTFNPLASPGDVDYGLLYIGIADGGAGGDPNKHAQNLAVGFGKIMRIDPLGTNSANGKYGIPADNPFAGDNNDQTLGEIFAYGVRNPQRLFWDRANGKMYMSDIGQNIVEEISPVSKGANLGWNTWEGSFRFISNNELNLDNPRGDPEVTYPIVEWGHGDPLLQRGSAAIGGMVYRGTEVAPLTGKIVFGDNPSGEIFFVDADNPPNGMEAPIRRVLINDGGQAKTFLQLIRDHGTDAGRADLRFGEGRDGKIYILNKADGKIRVLTGN